MGVLYFLLPQQKGDGLLMFSKNKPTKRVDLGDGNWVDLQFLSKGVKDAFKSDAADIYKDLEIDEEGKPKSNVIPEGMVGKVNEIQYRKVSSAIKTWSAADIPVTVETVKELDEEAFDKIVEFVNEMNDLSAKEEKN